MWGLLIMNLLKLLIFIDTIIALLTCYRYINTILCCAVDKSWRSDHKLINEFI